MFMVVVLPDTVKLPAITKFPDAVVSDPLEPNDFKPVIVLILGCEAVNTIPVTLPVTLPVTSPFKLPVNAPAIAPEPVMVGDINFLFVNVCVLVNWTISLFVIRAIFVAVSALPVHDPEEPLLVTFIVVGRE